MAAARVAPGAQLLRSRRASSDYYPPVRFRSRCRTARPPHARQKVRLSRAAAEGKGAGSLEQHFKSSAFFDETSCRHDYKLVGSKIYSSGRFQQQLHQDAEEAASSKNAPNSARATRARRGRVRAHRGRVLTYTPAVSSSNNTCSRESPPLDSSVVHLRGVAPADDGCLCAAACVDPQHESAGGETEVKETPPYVLTESLSTQKLWHQTAGRRPRQPSSEREFFAMEWEKNFENSAVDYTKPLAADGSGLTDRANGRTQTRVIYRATSPFGSAVSKSFKCENCGEISSIMVHIPKFQIVQAGSDVHAEYLIVVGLGTVTLGVWRRFREFKMFATKLALHFGLAIGCSTCGAASSTSSLHNFICSKLSAADLYLRARAGVWRRFREFKTLATKLASSSKRRQFHNALCSWHCLRARQRLFRCLDKDYLILKCFLLERFLHDLVFESMSPDTVREFLGVL
ncbi:hypothetical protein JKP88DRAFT_261486 [Tribonema minus]|uniref:PX domain-containing protein n=1 Tax=Tribonema minus TaxID=303371 RepID=A0A835YMJ5_9STRA|nr:hypothetical protein JKP88DRAFT_261486 [Tribonema minus]